MLRGILFHPLRGEFGWAVVHGPDGPRWAVDVARVMDMYIHTRWFMVFQRGLPFELCIHYELHRPTASTQIMPLLNEGLRTK